MHHDADDNNDTPSIQKQKNKNKTIIWYNKQTKLTLTLTVLYFIKCYQIIITCL